jgi:hypothetical protein
MPKDDQPDLIDVLDGCLTTEAGTNIPEVIVDLTDAVSNIGAQLETLNKIMVKILTQLKPKETD